MATAVANGVDFFDTLGVYGGGHSERLIDRFLQESKADLRVVAQAEANAAVSAELQQLPNNFYQDEVQQHIRGLY